MITILASYAQEESFSASENQKWRIRKNFQEGKPWDATILGYRYKNGRYGIEPGEAAIVRKIYDLYLGGKGLQAITNMLNEEGAATRFGKTWHISSVRHILMNPTYTGDLLLQKTFRTDHLTKRKVKNNGELQQFLVEEAHPAIIELTEWEAVQRELARRKGGAGPLLWNNGFGGKIVCGECGATFDPKVWHSNDVYRKVVWQCGHKYNATPDGEKQKPCSTPHLSEEQIKDAFCRALSALLVERDQIIEDGKAVIVMLTDCAALEKKASALDAELSEVAARVDRLVKENAVQPLDQEIYSKRYNELAGEYERLLRRLEAVEKEKKGRAEKRAALEAFYAELEALGELDMEFSPQRWNAIVEKVVVGEDGTMRFCFVNGAEVDV